MKKLTPKEWLIEIGRYTISEIAINKTYNPTFQDMQDYADYCATFSNEVSSVVYSLKQRLSDIPLSKPITMKSIKTYYNEKYEFVATVNTKNKPQISIVLIHKKTQKIIAEVNCNYDNNFNLQLLYLRSRAIEDAYKIYHRQKPTIQLLLEEYDYIIEE